jgi:hypothetical protein
MRQTAQVDVSVVGLRHEGALTDESCYDERTGMPSYTTREVSEFFFGHARTWLYDHLRRGHIELDAELVVIPFRPSGKEYRWRLCDVERTAIGLAQGGYIDAVMLYRALSIVRLVAESFGYLSTEVELVVGEHDPYRTEVAAVQTQEVVTDDLDGSQGAVERRFALGDIEYRIDLTEANWKALCELVRPFTDAARSTYRKATHPRQYGLKAVREWAQAQGLDVGRTGPVPHAITDAYLREHGQR